MHTLWLTFLQKMAAQARMKRTENTPTMKERMELRRKHHHFLQQSRPILIIMSGLIISVKKTALNRNVKRKYISDRLSLLICFTISISIFENFEKNQIWAVFWSSCFFSFPLEQTRTVLRWPGVLWLRDNCPHNHLDDISNLTWVVSAILLFYLLILKMF